MVGGGNIGGLAFEFPFSISLEKSASRAKVFVFWGLPPTLVDSDVAGALGEGVKLLVLGILGAVYDDSVWMLAMSLREVHASSSVKRYPEAVELMIPSSLPS